MDYLFAMQEMDLEIASEFLVMASTLLHIKSKMLLPSRKEEHQEEEDPRRNSYQGSLSTGNTRTFICAQGA